MPAISSRLVTPVMIAGTVPRESQGGQSPCTGKLGTVPITGKLGTVPRESKGRGTVPM